MQTLTIKKSASGRFERWSPERRQVEEAMDSGLIRNFDLLDFIPLSDLVYYIQTFRYFPETGMLPVKVGGILPAVTDKKLRSAGISSGMGHG